MRLKLNINYVTSFGEELFVDIFRNGRDSQPERHSMETDNGRDWRCTAELDIAPGTVTDYACGMVKNGIEQRHEWHAESHRLTLPPGDWTAVTLNDRWIDLPEDAPLYSSALTPDSLRHGSAEHLGGALAVKVRAPQLRPHERLALVGDDPALGGWEVSRALEMTEQQPNEWWVAVDVAALSRPLFEFKFVALSDKDSDDPLWEVGANRSMAVPALGKGECMVCELPQAAMPIYPWKGAGTVVPVFSLRSEGSFGVGDFGDLAAMADWVASTGQRVLQVLPVNDTTTAHTWQDSYPYNCISIYALHPQYIDFRQMPPLKDSRRREHYEARRRELNALPQIDYERMSEAKMDCLHELFGQEWATTRRHKDYRRFAADNWEWLVPYAVFCLCRDRYGTADFASWPDTVTVSADRSAVTFTPKGGQGQARTLKVKDRILGRELDFWYFTQYHLDRQMRAAHDHARSKGVILKGDIPIGISRNGVEAWLEPRYFNMDGQAGAPPDAFSPNGQNWGFPTYNWEEMLRDGCSWWVKRFRKMAEYFDAYRIDHVLGFFRIWEIPANAVHGLLGQFSPALPMTREEIEGYGLHFDEQLYTEPYIRDWMLPKLFGDRAGEVEARYLDHCYGDVWRLKPAYDTERKIRNEELRMKNEEPGSATHSSPAPADICAGLYTLASNVLFVRDHREHDKFHPRIGAQLDPVYEVLGDSEKFAFNRLYNDFFYRRHNQFWHAEAMKKLPLVTEATRMLACAEDLGMVPECVHWVMDELRILTLEIQSMPKEYGVRFGHLSHNPYLSVCTISTHDMPTLRQWWDEDAERAQEYYRTRLYRDGKAPHPLPGWLARDIVGRHLTSPSMLCLLSLQDWLAMDENLRLADENAERINIPAEPRHYWRYRMHLTIEQLMAARGLNDTVKTMVYESGRA